jgi:histone H3/H4
MVLLQAKCPRITAFAHQNWGYKECIEAYAIIVEAKSEAADHRRRPQIACEDISGSGERGVFFFRFFLLNLAC